MCDLSLLCVIYVIQSEWFLMKYIFQITRAIISIIRIHMVSSMISLWLTNICDPACTFQYAYTIFGVKLQWSDFHSCLDVINQIYILDSFLMHHSSNYSIVILHDTNAKFGMKICCSILSIFVSLYILYTLDLCHSFSRTNQYSYIILLQDAWYYLFDEHWCCITKYFVFFSIRYSSRWYHSQQFSVWVWFHPFWWCICIDL